MFLGVVLVGLLIGWLATPGEAEIAEVGQRAPDFTVPLIGGGFFTLSEQLNAEDRPIVLNLWASWCIPCRVETLELSAFAQAHPDVFVIGVAVEDTQSSSERFAEEFEPSYDLGLGHPDFEAAYPRIGLPVTYIIGSNGIVKDWFNGILTQETLTDLLHG